MLDGTLQYIGIALQILTHQTFPLHAKTTFKWVKDWNFYGKVPTTKKCHLIISTNPKYHVSWKDGFKNTLLSWC